MIIIMSNSQVNLGFGYSFHAWTKYLPDVRIPNSKLLHAKPSIIFSIFNSKTDVPADAYYDEANGKTDSLCI